MKTIEDESPETEKLKLYSTTTTTATTKNEIVANNFAVRLK